LFPNKNPQYDYSWEFQSYSACNRHPENISCSFYQVRISLLSFFWAQRILVTYLPYLDSHTFSLPELSLILCIESGPFERICPSRSAYQELACIRDRNQTRVFCLPTKYWRNFLSPNSIKFKYGVLQAYIKRLYFENIFFPFGLVKNRQKSTLFHFFFLMSFFYFSKFWNHLFWHGSPKYGEFRTFRIYKKSRTVFEL